MLAPSVATVRRPSCEADLILSRIEGIDAPLYPSLPASDSVQSAPLYDYWTPEGGEDIAAASADAAPSTQVRPEGTIAAGGGGGRSCLTGRIQESWGTLSVSPDMRIKFGHHRRRASQQGGLKEDAAAADGKTTWADLRRSPVDSWGIRRASVTLRRSIDSLLCTLATKQPRAPAVAPVERTAGGLSIEVVHESPIFRRRIRLKQRGKSLDKAAAAAAAAATAQGDPVDYDCFGSPPGHLLLSLVLVSLKDGLLRAEIPIDELHRIPSGHVKIKIRNYNLDVCISTPSSSSSSFGEERGLSQQGGCSGTVSLPIYVNPSSLQFRLDETRPVVHLEGKIKGCCTRIGTSFSAMELSRATAVTAVGGEGGASVVVATGGNGSS